MKAVDLHPGGSPSGRDWCTRLDDAICDGRYGEDPEIWTVHVQSCDDCRRKVEGLALIEGLFSRIAERTPAVDPSPETKRRLIEGVFHRYERRRQRLRNTGLCVLALVGTVLVYAASRPSPTPEVDPVAYARQLHDRVFPYGQNPRYALLREDEALRKEYFAALDHPSSLVRRTALTALLSSGVQIPVPRMEAILAGWEEGLERPLLVGSSKSAAVGSLEAALDSWRGNTIKTLVGGSKTLWARNQQGIRASLLTPFLQDPDADTRADVVYALEWDPNYRPGEEMIRALDIDPEWQVRAAASHCLMKRLGEEGVRIVIEHLRTVADEEVEVLSATGFHTSERGVAFSRERIHDPKAGLRARVMHARVLFRTGVTQAPREVLDAALASSEPRTLELMASTCKLAGWSEYRLPLHDRWRALPPSSGRTSLAVSLAGWHIDTNSDDALQLALEIFRADPDTMLDRSLGKLAQKEDRAAGREARALLDARKVK